MSLYTEILADIQYMSEELGSPVFTWKGVDYVCVPGTANKEKDLDIGGLLVTADLVITVRTDLFDNSIYPVPQTDKLIYAGETYRVIKIGKLAHGAAIRLHCVNEFRMK